MIDFIDGCDSTQRKETHTVLCFKTKKTLKDIKKTRKEQQLIYPKATRDMLADKAQRLRISTRPGGVIQRSGGDPAAPPDYHLPIVLMKITLARLFTSSEITFCFVFEV